MQKRANKLRHLLQRYPALKALGTYSMAVYIGQALTLLRGILIARVLGPAGFGIWSVIKLLLAYSTQLNGGTLQAMRQELPHAIGQRQFARAKHLVQVLTTLNVFVIGLIIAVCLLGSAVGHWFWPHLPRWAWFFIAVLAAGEVACQFVQVKLQSEEHVKRYSRLTFTYAAVAAVAMPLGAIWLGLAGALCGLVLAQAVCLVWAFAVRELAMPAKISFYEVKPLLAVGVPIWMTWLPVMLLGDIDQWLVAHALGTTALGLYGAALFLGGLLQYLPFIYRTIYQPFIMRRLGATRSWQQMKPHVFQSLFLAAYASPIVIAVLYLLAEPLIVLILPAYRQGLPAAKSYVLCCFWFMIAQTTYMVCTSARKEKRWFAHTMIAIVTHVLLTGYVLKRGGGLLSATLCFGIVFFGYASAQLKLVAETFENGWEAWLRLTAKIAVPFVYTSALLLAIDFWWVLPASAGMMIAVSLLRMVFAVLVLSGFYRLANSRWRFAEVLSAAAGQRVQALYEPDPVVIAS